MLWLKAFHIIAMVAWFAGLFYLPRLFVYHTEVDPSDSAANARFCKMESRLYWAIMTPSGIITVLLGIGLMHSFHYSFMNPPTWLSMKLLLVGALIVFHLMCGWFVNQFKQGARPFSGKFYRWINEIPTVILIGTVLLVVTKPF